MRILGISGSPRGANSNTRRLVELVLQGAKSAGAETELVDLSEIKITYCIACGVCHVNGDCTRDDEFDPLREKMLSSEGIVLGSPDYFESVTSQLKTVIDRLSDAIHCQLFLGKYACSVVTAGGPDYDQVIRYMNGVLVRLGCSVVGGLGAMMSIPGSLDAAEQQALPLGVELVKAISEQRTYPDQDAVHAAMRDRFKMLVTLNKESWPYDYDCWKRKGWL
jgi:multimeric flavodoxin WrbA